MYANQPRTSLLMALTLAALVAPVSASAQDTTPAAPVDAPPPIPARPGNTPPATTPPDIRGATLVDINYDEADLLGLVQYFSRATGRNFILGDTRELQGKKITIISNKKVTPAAAYEAFLSALEVHGLTIVRVGDVHKIIKAQVAQQSPGTPGEGANIRSTDQYITQIIPFENVSVTDVREIVDNLVSPNAKVLAYAPSNTLILTDTGYNIRRIFDIVSELDIAAPKSSMLLYPIKFADATELKDLIQELYGTAEDEDTTPANNRRTRRTSRTSRTTTPETGTGVTAGKASNYISKIMADERTNTLIALANEEGHTAIRDMIAKIDIDVDPASASKIFVVRLEHAKAEDVASVLRDLAESGGGGGGRNQGASTDPRVNAARARAEAATAAADGAAGSGESGGAIAAFDSGARIAADENTNSLVIIATQDDYEVIASVIEKLDAKRKQVFVDTVILELSSIDSFDFNIAYHTPFSAGDAVGVVGSQLGTNSLGFSTESLTGLGLGVFGQTIPVPVLDPTSGSVTTLDIPSFGIAVQALKTNQMVNIVSTPSLLALDNEEAKIVVGRKIPFPTSSGLNSLGQPVISFQREDVAITLEMTPRINSENFVTLELKVEVQEIEESDSVNVAQAGFITSKREIDTVALVGDNQTVVLGGLVGSTDTEGESKIPILGDLPLIGALFRSKTKSARRTNLMVFLTPHIIDDADDMAEIMRVKEAQRQEFMRRFYGKSQDEQFAEIRRLLQYSMNAIDRPSVYRGPTTVSSTVTLDGQPISAQTRLDIRDEVARAGVTEPGQMAGSLPEGEPNIELPAAEVLPAPVRDEVEATPAAPVDDAADEIIDDTVVEPPASDVGSEE